MTTYVSADWVASCISDPNFLIIDTRYSMRHLMGHLQHAVNVPPPKLRNPQGELLSPNELSDLFGAAGLGDFIHPSCMTVTTEGIPRLLHGFWSI